MKRSSRRLRVSNIFRPAQSTPHPSRLRPQLPAFAVTALSHGCGKIHREEGVLMRSGCAEKRNERFGFRRGDLPFFGDAPTAIAPSSVPAIGRRFLFPQPARRNRSPLASNHPSSVWFNAPALVALHPNNTINIDKFTGFFDKLMKRDSTETYCNTMNYIIFLSVAHKDSGQIKFSGSRAFARICAQWPSHRPRGAAMMYVGAGRPGISTPPRTHNCELEPPSRFMASRTPRPPLASGRARYS